MRKGNNIKKSGWDVSWPTSELSVSTPTRGRLNAAQAEGNVVRRRSKERNVSR